MVNEFGTKEFDTAGEALFRNNTPIWPLLQGLIAAFTDVRRPSVAATTPDHSA
jgi:hypothetical protein